jgi:hypothetical protein
MAANKRNKWQRERDLELISRECLRGKTQEELARLCGVSQAQIHYDLKVLHKRWLESSQINMAEAKAKELAKIDALEKTYAEAWERSLKEKETKTAEKTTAGQSGRTRALSRQEQRDGNPAFLAGIQWCIEQRCKILGLVPKEGPPQPAAPSVNVAIQQDSVGLTDDEKRLVIDFRRQRQLAAQSASAPTGVSLGVPL